MRERGTACREAYQLGRNVGWDGGGAALLPAPRRRAMAAPTDTERAPAGLTPEQERALLRYLGSGSALQIVMAPAGSRFVRFAGEAAMKLVRSHALLGRTVRYGQRGRTIYVADMQGL